MNGITHDGRPMRYRHGSLAAYNHAHCRCPMCSANRMAYERKYRLERRVILLADKYEQAVAHLEALGDLVPAGSPVQEAPAPLAPSSPSRQAVPPVAPARAVLLPVPATVGSWGRWRCGHEGEVPFRLTSTGPARLPCPNCGKPGLTAQRGPTGWAAVAP